MTEEFVQQAILNPLQDEKCVDLHPGVSCDMKMLRQIKHSFQNLHKIYLIAHLIPFILFKRKRFRQRYLFYLSRPVEETKKFIIGFIRSMLFSVGNMVVGTRVSCIINNAYKFQSINGIIGCFIGSACILFEQPNRRAEITLYCMNKSL